MALSRVLERLGRAVFESPFESKRLAADAPELAEIRLAAIDAIKAASHRVSGVGVFPYDAVRIRLAGIPREQAEIFATVFIRNYFADELRTALRRMRHRFPQTLAVEFLTSPELPAPGGSWITVDLAMQTPAIERENAATGRALPPATLTVHEGNANHSQLGLTKARTNIGRTVEVFRKAGPSRRNDLAFTGESEADRSVSREHAHITRSPTGDEYRLFNDRLYRGEENCALWIVRDGLSFAVHHSARGTALQDGDEIHLGRAVLRFSSEFLKAAVPAD